MATVARLLLTAGPHVYDWALPPALADVQPLWARLLGGAAAGGDSHAIEALATRAGQPLVGFAKGGAYTALIHDDLIAPYWRSPMAWETWRRGSGALPSLCPPAANSSALNVGRVAFPPGGSAPAGWGWSADHSKWGVSVGGGARVACIGDMNRDMWQRQRGGGFVCMAHAGLWAAMHGLLAEVDGCPLLS